MCSLCAGLTEESHIHGVGMVMATPRLHYDPKPKPAVKAVDPRPRHVNSAIPTHPQHGCLLQAIQKIDGCGNANGFEILRPECDLSTVILHLCSMGQTSCCVAGKLLSGGGMLGK